MPFRILTGLTSFKNSLLIFPQGSSNLNVLQTDIQLE